MLTQDSGSDERRIGRQHLVLLGWSAALAPAGIVLHELGHFIVGRAYGFPVRLNVGSVSGGASLGSAPDMTVALQASAGPLVTIGLMAIAMLGLSKPPLRLWALALAITAPIRFIVGGTYLFWVAKALIEGTRFQGTPNFDEYNAAIALGISPVALVMVQMVALAMFWAWAINRAKPIGRIISLVSIMIGAVIGIVLWMALIGPAVLALA
jgi:hypothetical protein